MAFSNSTHCTYFSSFLLLDADTFAGEIFHNDCYGFHRHEDVGPGRGRHKLQPVPSLENVKSYSACSLSSRIKQYSLVTHAHLNNLCQPPYLLITSRVLARVKLM